MPRFDFDPAALQVMPSAERFAALADALDTLTLANLTDRLGETFGRRTAFIMEQPLRLPGTHGTTISFAELARLVAHATGALAALGLTRGDRVALCTRNRMELVVAEWAVLRAGGVAVPIGARLPADEIVRIIDDAGARLLVTDSAVLAGPLAGQALPVAHRIVVDGDGDGDTLGLGRLLEAASAPRPAEVAESDLAVIFYTSGTTGRAKGVMLTHGNLMFATRAGLRQTAWMGPPPPILALMVMPLANTSGHQALLFSIVRGTTVIVLDRFDARTMLDIVERHRVNLLSGTPTMSSTRRGGPSPGGRWGSRGCAAQPSCRATGARPRRGPRPPPTAGSAPAPSCVGAPSRGDSSSRAAPRTSSSPAATPSTRRR